MANLFHLLKILFMNDLWGLSFKLAHARSRNNSVKTVGVGVLKLTDSYYLIELNQVLCVLPYFYSKKMLHPTLMTFL